jgi:hypothetical protein
LHLCCHSQCNADTRAHDCNASCLVAHRYREVRPSPGGIDGEMSVEAWNIGAKSSSKERWQTFAATPTMLFTAAQNAATIGCWVKVGSGKTEGGGSGGAGSATADGAMGRIELVATETITAYPHQIKVRLTETYGPPQ